jgi:hypothetical protein
VQKGERYGEEGLNDRELADRVVDTWTIRGTVGMKTGRVFLNPYKRLKVIAGVVAMLRGP